MSDEKNSIEQTVQVYFDSMYESDSAKVDQAFHPNAMITGSFDGDLKGIEKVLVNSSRANSLPQKIRESLLD